MSASFSFYPFNSLLVTPQRSGSTPSCGRTQNDVRPLALGGSGITLLEGRAPAGSLGQDSQECSSSLELGNATGGLRSPTQNVPALNHPLPHSFHLVFPEESSECRYNFIVPPLVLHLYIQQFLHEVVRHCKLLLKTSPNATTPDSKLKILTCDL